MRKLRKEESSFSVEYGIARRRNPSLRRLSGKVLQQIETQIALSRSFVPSDVNDYIAIIVVALVSLASLPLLSETFYFYILNWREAIYASLSAKVFLDSHFGVILSIVLVLFAIPNYTLLLPRIWPLFDAMTRRFLRSKTKSKRFVDLKSGLGSFRYVLFAILSNYLAIILALILIISYTSLPKQIVLVTITVWFMIPGVILSIFPLVLGAILVAIIRERRRPSEGKSCGILFRIVKILNKIDNSGSLLNLSETMREDMAQRISRTGYIITSLYEDKYDDRRHPGPVNAMLLRAGMNFISLRNHVLLPKGDRFLTLKTELCRYFNAFAAGRYNFLFIDTKVDSATDKGGLAEPARRQGLFAFIMLAAFIALPIVLLVFVVNFLRIELAPIVQSLLGTLYIGWVTIGLFVFSDKMKPETKGLIKDLLGSLLGKG